MFSSGLTMCYSLVDGLIKTHFISTIPIFIFCLILYAFLIGVCHQVLLDFIWTHVEKRQRFCYESRSWRPHDLIILQWRHDERDGVSNNQSHDCLLERFFRPRSKKTSVLRLVGLWGGGGGGIHRSPVNSQHKGSVTRKIFPFDDVIMKF